MLTAICIVAIILVTTVLYLILEADVFGITRILKKQDRYDYYIAGPMRGYPGHNHLAFKLAAKLLRNRGYKIFSPAEVNDIGKPYAECMKIDLNAVINLCGGVLLLDGWEKSLGANTETLTGFVCGKHIRKLDIKKSDKTKDGYEISFSPINEDRYLLPYNYENPK